MPRTPYDEPQAETAFQAAYDRAKKDLADNLTFDKYAGGQLSTAAASQSMDAEYRTRRDVYK